MSSPLTGIAPPQAAATGLSPLQQVAAPTASGSFNPAIYDLSSDQQLAYYRSLLNKIPVNYTQIDPLADDGGDGQAGLRAKQTALDLQAETARNAAFEKTLSPEDLKNYQGLSEQYRDNVNHSADNLGMLSLALMGVGGGLAGAYGGAAGAGSGGATGMALGAGADATAWNPALIDSYLGTTGYGASSASLLPGAAPAFSAVDGLANSGSDAHFYQPQQGGVGVQDLGNMGGSSTATIPSSANTTTGSSPLSQVGDKLSSLTPGQILNGVKAVAPLLGAISGSKSGSTMGGSSSSSGSIAAPADMGKASRYDYTGFTADSAPASRPGHTMGPSSAVNLNDPSAAMFGYGKAPLYYQQPHATPDIPGAGQQLGHPMAGGGSVDPEDFVAQDDRTPVGADVNLFSNPGNVAAPPSYGPGSDSSLGDQKRVTGDSGNPIMDWITRLANGDKKTNSQLQLGLGGLGLLASLLGKHQAPLTYQNAAQLKAGLPNNSGMTPQQLANLSNYFNAPAARYVPPVPGVVTVPKSGYAEGGSALDAMRDAHGEGSPEAYIPSIHGSYVQGNGAGQHDQVDARLAHGEYVWDADTVAALGDGNNEHGAKLLDATREAIRAHKRSAPSSSIPPAAKSPLDYMRSAAGSK